MTQTPAYHMYNVLVHTSPTHDPNEYTYHNSLDYSRSHVNHEIKTQKEQTMHGIFLNIGSKNTQLFNMQLHETTNVKFSSIDHD